MKTQFNFNRFGLLLQRYFTERLHIELISWSIMLIAFLFCHSNIAIVSGIILGAGLFYASRFFREIHSSTNSSAYFMIPATQLEKLTAGILITTFYYFGMMLVVYTIGGLLGTLLNNMLAFLPMFHITVPKLVLFATTTTSYVANGVPITEVQTYLRSTFEIFLLIQSVFLLGSIYFKNNQAIKTFFATTVILILLFIVFIVEFYFIAVGTSDIHWQSGDYFDWKHIAEIGVTVLCYTLPVFFWVVSYFRLTEKEV